MKRVMAAVALVIGAGFWASSQFDSGRRDLDTRSLTAQEEQQFSGFVAKFTDSDSAVRLKAVLGLIAFNSLRSQPYLIRALSDPSREVVIAAIGGLRDLKYRIGPTGNIWLIALCSHNDMRVREVAQRALPELADWRAAEFLIDEAERDGCECRALMLGALEYVTSHEIVENSSEKSLVTFSEGIRKILDDGEPNFPEIPDLEAERLCAMWRVWFDNYRDRDPRAWLIDDLASGRGDKIAQIRALVRLRAKEGASLVAKSLADENSSVVIAAAKAARSFRDTEALPMLIAAGEGAELKIWEEISRSIASLCDRKDKEVIFSALKDADAKRFDFYNRALEQLTAAHADFEPEEREQIVEFWRGHLNATAKKSDFEAWSAMLRSTSAGDRLQAAKNLRREAEAAVPLYIAALMDESEAVRRIADRYLREITFYYFEYDPLGPREERAKVVNEWRGWWERVAGVERFERLVAVMQNRGETVRHRADAARGLRESGDWRAVPHLIAALGEQPEGLRHYAGKALVKLVGRSFPRGDGWVEGDEQSHDAWLGWWRTYRGKPKEIVNIATITDINEERAQDVYRYTDKLRDKLVIINRIALERDANSIQHLVNLLDNQSILLSVTAEEALERITGRSFFYRRNVRISDRASVKEVWREWYENR